MATDPIPGSCLCGLVAFEVVPPFLKFVHCHCSRCRKSTGASHATNLAVPASQVTWSRGEDSISEFKLPAAQRFGKWFCRECGASVPRPLPGTGIVVVPAGSLDGPLPQEPTENTYWGSRAQWGYTSSHLPVFDGSAPTAGPARSPGSGGP